MKSFLTCLAGFLVLIVVALFIASFFLDPILRARVERDLNEKLVGYRTHLGHAHLQLLSGTLTLSDNWQAFVQLLGNAFVKAILPGFDHQVGTQANNSRSTSSKVTRRSENFPAFIGYFLAIPVAPSRKVAMTAKIVPNKKRHTHCST